jgi:cell division protein FtsW (lipid II flippase)
MSTTRRINVDLPLIAIGIALSFFGLAIVFSAGQTDVRTVAAGAYKSQAVWIVIGLIAAYGVSRASVRLIEWATVPAYAFTIVLLLALLVGLGSGAGSRSAVTD